MQSWSTPEVPSLPVTGPAVSIFDTSRGAVIATSPIGEARLYVCGITPYDATHMGHAATYVAFDLLNRAWRNAGHNVHYVQNVTDIDDPLLERATKVNVDWRELALRETDLFREDMAALRVLPPRDYVGAVESIPLVIELVEKLQTTGAVYQVETDLYFSVTADADFGKVSRWTREQMLEVFADRGGDPERPGKKDPLDCLLWLGEREGEPAWESPFGRGRPGWHIECAAIALEHLGTGLDVQGGGSDLIFPHHEMSAGEVQVAIPGSTFANAYAHAGMVAYNGEKMSKSKGNLVFVSAVRRSDIDPMAIRMTLLRQHYRSDWEWTDALLGDSAETLDEWRLVVSTPAGAPAGPVVDSVLAALADDLDAPRALSAVGDWMRATRAGDTSDPAASASIQAVLDAALGLKL